jgi:ubiquinone/menaquinone biosynthesis C-methylase UbiE
MNNNDHHNKIVQSFLPDSYRIWFEKETKYLTDHITDAAFVLDIGSGDGRTIMDLLPITRNITAIDHDAGAVERAQVKFANVPSVHIQVADATQLPFEDEQFDFVTCMGVL